MVKLLIGILIVLGLLFVGLLWAVAILAKVSLWIPGGITALIAIVLLSVWVVRALMARKAAEGLEQALAGQAREQARMTRPDMQPQMMQMQADFEASISSLKQSKLGRGGRDALYVLPWYAIIGPPGAGKSTALRNSGLQFPAMERGGAAVRGLGGTRNCDWWLTNEAVLLDTAGRWSTQEEDHGEWLSFLGMLKKFRTRKPLNGLIAAVSIGEIANGTPDEVDALAARIRERVDEVMGELKVSLPVYVLFTKCDLVEGFVDMFGDMSRADRSQVWGFTVPLTASHAEWTGLVDEEVGTLADVLDRRASSRLADERNPDVRHRIYAFPQQFAMMRRNVARFVNVVFEDNIYKDTPTLRGVYFSSGTQEGRPFNLLINKLAGALGVERRVQSHAQVVDQKSYFLGDLFTGVIFADRDVASASEVELRRRRIVRLALTGLLFVVAGCLSAVPGYAWVQNGQMLGDIEGMLDRWEQRNIEAGMVAAPRAGKGSAGSSEAASEKRSGEILAQLQPLREATERLRTYEADGPPLSMSFGMYQGDELGDPLARYYATLVRRELVRPTVAHGVQRLTDFGFRYEALPHAQPKSAEHARFYDALKLHLLVSGPKQPTEPGLVDHAEWVASRLVASWVGTDPEPADLKAAVTNAKLYTTFASEMPGLDFPRDGAVVGRVRAALNRVPTERRALQRLIASVDEDGFEQSLPTLVGRLGVIEAKGRVRGAFTRRGWETKIRDLLSSEQLDHAGELWVLGGAGSTEEGEAQAALQVAELSSAYLRAYVLEWQEFLRSVRIPRPENHAGALQVLRAITRGQPPPIALLLQRVHYNVQLKEKEKSEVDGAVDGALGVVGQELERFVGKSRLGKKAQAALDAKQRRRGALELLQPADVAKAFEGLSQFAVPPETEEGGPVAAVPYDAYQEQLYYVRDALQTHEDDPSQSAQMLEKLQAARTRVRSLIDEQQVGWRPFYENLLWPPIDGAAMSSNLAVASATGNKWCDEVFDAYTGKLRRHYPFARGGHDAALGDFVSFYGPEGIVARFVHETLGGAVEQDGDRFEFSRTLGRDASSVYSSELLTFLQRSHDVSASFFPDGTEPGAKLLIRIHPSPWVATTTFKLGGAAIEYHNGPEKWETLRWPGEAPDEGATIEVRGANGMNERLRQEGVWGVFRLVEQGSVVRSTAQTFTVAWELQTHGVTIKADIRTTGGSSPFFGVQGRSKNPGFLQPVRAKGGAAPKKIVLSARSCRG